MAPVYFPPGVKARGNAKVTMVTVVAVETSIKMTEISAATSLELSGYLSDTGWAQTVTQNKGSAPRRLASTQVPEQFGDTTFSLGDLVYATDPQGVAASLPVKAYEALTPGLTRYFVVRWGIDANTDFAVGQFASLWKATLGLRNETPDMSDEFGEFQITQPVIVPIGGRLVERAAIVA